MEKMVPLARKKQGIQGKIWGLEMREGIQGKQRKLEFNLYFQGASDVHNTRSVQQVMLEAMRKSVAHRMAGNVLVARQYRRLR
jgi:hypothetical protein